MALVKKLNWTNHILKFLSIILGFLLWFYVLNSEPVTVQKDFEIDIVLPKSVAFQELPVKKVSVTLKGARTFIDTLLKQENKIFIDLSKEKLSLAKKYTHHLKQKHIPVPFNVDVIEIRPKTLIAKFEKRLLKNLIVKPKLIGELDRGLQIKDYQVEPKTIRVSGPSSVLKKLEFIESTPIDVSTFDDEGSLLLNFSKFDERISLIDQKNVVFKYQIKSKDSNLTLQNIPILFLSSEQNFAVKQKMVAIDVLVSEELSKNLKRSDIKIIAEIPQDFEGETDVELSARLPKGVIVQKIHPPKVLVRRLKKSK